MIINNNDDKIEFRYEEEGTRSFCLSLYPEGSLEMTVQNFFDFLKAIGHHEDAIVDCFSEYVEEDPKDLSSLWGEKDWANPLYEDEINFVGYAETCTGCEYELQYFTTDEGGAPWGRVLRCNQVTSFSADCLNCGTYHIFSNGGRSIEAHPPYVRD